MSISSLKSRIEKLKNTKYQKEMGVDGHSFMGFSYEQIITDNSGIDEALEKAGVEKVEKIWQKQYPPNKPITMTGCIIGEWIKEKKGQNEHKPNTNSRTDNTNYDPEDDNGND